MGYKNGIQKSLKAVASFGQLQLLQLQLTLLQGPQRQLDCSLIDNADLILDGSGVIRE
jgi:hypothetical protein